MQMIFIKCFKAREIFKCIEDKLKNEEYEEETYMLLNPTDRYLLKKGRLEGRLEGKCDVAQNLLNEGFSIEKVVKLTGLSKEDILNAK